MNQINRFKACSLAFACTLCFLGRTNAVADVPLTAQSPVPLPGAGARFDYLNVDVTRHRLLAAHTGANEIVVFDLKQNAWKASIPVGTAQGVVADDRDNQYISGNSKDQKVVFINAETLKVTGEVALSGPVDDIELDSKTGLLYADHDDGTDVWVIDPKTKKLLGSVTIPEAPEYIRYDPVTNRLYQNIKSNNTLQVINPATRSVEAVWQTAPATGPHGLSLDSSLGRVFSAGNNGKLDVFDIRTGKILTTVDIAAGVDQIAYDPGLKRVYCACRGMLSVVQITDSGARLLANVPSPRGAHTLAVDPETHSVWVAYSDTAHSYLQEFKAGS